MNCELYQADLKAYRDRELPPFRRLAVRRHLAGCAFCRNEVRTMEQISKNLQATQSTEPLSQNLRTRILDEAAKQGAPASAPAPSLLGAGEAKRRLSPTLVGAICTMLAVTALFAMHPWQTSNQRIAQVGANDYGIARDAMPSPMPKAAPMVEQQTATQKSAPSLAPSGEVANYDANARREDSYKDLDKDGLATTKWHVGKPDYTYNIAPKLKDGSGKVDIAGGSVPVEMHSALGAPTASAPPSAGANIAGASTMNGRNGSPSNTPTVVAQAPSSILYAAPPPTGGADTSKANGFRGGGFAAPGGGGRGGAGPSPGAATDNEVQAPAATKAVPPPSPQGRLNINGNVTFGTLYDNISLDRQVHREATITVQMKDPEAASDQVSQVVKFSGGYVASNNLTTNNGLKSAQMTLKVPVAQFETVLVQIEKLGNVTAKNVIGEDITGKVSDAGQAESVLDDEATRANARLQSLGRHAKWNDVQDARELRIEVAQARARVQLLNKLAALADITVTLTQTPTPAPPVQSGFLDNMKGSGAAAFQSLMSSVGALLTMLIWALAYAPIWGPLVFAAWYAMRRKREQSQMSGV